MILPLLLQAQTAAERFDALRGGLDIPIGQRLTGLIGIVVMIALATLLSYDRRRINWRLVATGVSIQVVFGLVVLKTDAGRAVFQTFGNWITALLGFQEQGARFVFGNLVQNTVPVGLPDATGAVDVTGGMLSKVSEMCRLVVAHPQMAVHLVSGQRAGALVGALLGTDTGGTRILAD